MIWRFVAHLPEWRAFGREPVNWIDLMLAVGSSIIQIPAIHTSQAYAWLTVFQLARWYRVILEVPRMRPLILTVFGNSSGLLNMIAFMLITNGLAALAAVQLLRGDMTPPGNNNNNNMNFSQIWISFLAMYQVRYPFRLQWLYLTCGSRRSYHRRIGPMYYIAQPQQSHLQQCHGSL
jgi:voltage-dependent calcium channel